jgi:hypothetical protein
MAHATHSTAIPHTDEDILEDIHNLVRSYKPLITSRGHFYYRVQTGVVTVWGNIKSRSAHQLFAKNLPDVDGVIAVDDSKLYNDETLRLEIGKLLPMGIRTRIHNGLVTLTGQLPADTNADDIKGELVTVPGVIAVNTDFN